MKRTSIIAACLFSLGIAGDMRADLKVWDPVAGETVVYDDITGYSWIWDTTMFTDMTYQQQLDSISAQGSYGGLTGWHMASDEEWGTLKASAGYDTVNLGAAFAPTYYSSAGFHVWSGRTDVPLTSTGGSLPWGETPEYHNMHYFDILDPTTYSGPEPDIRASSYLGAWVVTPVPAPGAVLLGVIGLSAAGLKLRRSN